jgi:hypothetical protein
VEGEGEGLSEGGVRVRVSELHSKIPLPFPFPSALPPQHACMHARVNPQTNPTPGPNPASSLLGQCVNPGSDLGGLPPEPLHDQVGHDDAPLVHHTMVQHPRVARTQLHARMHT